MMMMTLLMLLHHRKEMMKAWPGSLCSCFRDESGECVECCNSSRDRAGQDQKRQGRDVYIDRSSLSQPNLARH